MQWLSLFHYFKLIYFRCNCLKEGQTWFTGAVVIIDPIQASSVVPAWVVLTFIDVDLTVRPSVTRLAETSVTVDHIDAKSIVKTRVTGTFIRFTSASRTDISRHAIATEGIHAVDARTAILAMHPDAVVDFNLAVVACETIPAEALIAVDVVNAGGAVQAGSAFAFINIYFAVHTNIPRKTFAYVVRNAINA